MPTSLTDALTINFDSTVIWAAMAVYLVILCGFFAYVHIREILWEKSRYENEPPPEFWEKNGYGRDNF
jgi:hypothetical protein